MCSFTARLRRLQLCRAPSKRMECHYCDDGADVVVEKDGIRVGVCETHFREQMDVLADSEFLEEIQDEIDVDRAE